MKATYNFQITHEHTRDIALVLDTQKLSCHDFRPSWTLLGGAGMTGERAGMAGRAQGWRGERAGMAGERAGMSGEQGWRSSESARLPPMCPGFDSWTRRHMCVEFVVGFLPCSERFFSGFSGFPLSSKTNISKFQFDLNYCQALYHEPLARVITQALPVFDIKFTLFFYSFPGIISYFSLLNPCMLRGHLAIT